ncbi:MAG: hypothetical protein U5S82_20520 [Gammaproteobacteria bacterium]|nr:hypothetical protein [Gammaproteobacteria bacterium]
MSRIEFEVLKPQAALDTFADTWRRSQAGEDIPPRIVFGSLHELFSAITEKRLELVRFVAQQPGLNTHMLAGKLGRDYKNVHTDVARLMELQLLEKDPRGQLSAPFDELVIHATVRDAA